PARTGRPHSVGLPGRALLGLTVHHVRVLRSSAGSHDDPGRWPADDGPRRRRARSRWRRRRSRSHRRVRLRRRSRRPRAVRVACRRPTRGLHDVQRRLPRKELHCLALRHPCARRAARVRRVLAAPRGLAPADRRLRGARRWPDDRARPRVSPGAVRRHLTLREPLAVNAVYNTTRCYRRGMIKQMIVIATLALAACPPPMPRGRAVAPSPEPVRATECRDTCRAVGMELAQMVFIMNSTGCVCQASATAPGTTPAPGAAAGAAAGGAAIAATIAA